MSHQLLIMRHAKAERDADRWEDFDRPLSERGLRDASEMGRWLLKQKMRPDHILSSPAVRTTETARRVGAELKYKGTIEYPKSLYEGADRAYVTQIALCPVAVKTLLVVGHNPALEQLVEWLCGEWVTLKTAAVAHLLHLHEDWSEIKPGSLKLVEEWTPKSIGDE